MSIESYFGHNMKIHVRGWSYILYDGLYLIMVYVRKDIPCHEGKAIRQVFALSMFGSRKNATRLVVSASLSLSLFLFL